MNDATERIEEARPRRFRRYPEYKDSGVEWLGEIPKDWEVGRLKDHGAFVGGAGFPHDYQGSDNEVLPFYKVGDLSTSSDGRYMGQAPNTVSLEIAAELRAHVIPVDSIIYAKIGAALLLNRRRITTMPCCIDNNMSAYVPRRGALASEWAFHWTTIVDFAALANPGAVPSLSEGDQADIPIVIPPMSEQRAIAAFLDRETARIDGLVERKERLIELLQEKRTALITRAVTQGLDPLTGTSTKGSNVFPVVPKDWILWKIRRLIRRVRRPIVVRPDMEYQEIGIRSWGKGIFHKDPVRGALLGEKSVFRIEPGDFVLNIVFAWEGAVAVVSRHEKGMIASHRFPTFRPLDYVDLDYLLMVLQSDQGRRLMEVNSPGAAGRNKTLRIGQFLEEELPLPNLEVQRATVASFRKKEGRLSTLAAKIRQAIYHLKESRSALISAAVTGKIDVREEAS